jgi:hypothetical protein
MSDPQTTTFRERTDRLLWALFFATILTTSIGSVSGYVFSCFMLASQLWVEGHPFVALYGFMFLVIFLPLTALGYIKQ